MKVLLTFSLLLSFFIPNTYGFFYFLDKKTLDKSALDFRKVSPENRSLVKAFSIADLKVGLDTLETVAVHEEVKARNLPLERSYYRDQKDKYRQYYLNIEGPWKFFTFVNEEVKNLTETKALKNRNTGFCDMSPSSDSFSLLLGDNLSKVDLEKMSIDFKEADFAIVGAKSVTKPKLFNPDSYKILTVSDMMGKYPQYLDLMEKRSIDLIRDCLLSTKDKDWTGYHREFWKKGVSGDVDCTKSVTDYNKIRTYKNAKCFIVESDKYLFSGCEVDFGRKNVGFFKNKETGVVTRRNPFEIRDVKANKYVDFLYEIDGDLYEIEKKDTVVRAANTYGDSPKGITASYLSNYRIHGYIKDESLKSLKTKLRYANMDLVQYKAYLLDKIITRFASNPTELSIELKALEEFRNKFDNYYYLLKKENTTKEEKEFLKIPKEDFLLKNYNHAYLYYAIDEKNFNPQVDGVNCTE